MFLGALFGKGKSKAQGQSYYRGRRGEDMFCKPASLSVGLELSSSVAE